MKMGICRFCGSGDLRLQGRRGGDPFDQSPEMLVCGNCGRVVSTEDDIRRMMEADLARREEKERYIVVEMRARACNVERTAYARFPFKDGGYCFPPDYPFSRFQSGLGVEGDVITIDGVRSRLTAAGITMTKFFTAYDYSHIGWQETVDIYVRIEEKE